MDDKNIGLDDIRKAIHTYRPPTHFEQYSNLIDIRKLDKNQNENDTNTSGDIKLLINNFQKIVGVATMLTNRCDTAYAEIKDMKRTIKEFENLVDSCREREHRHISALSNHRNIQKSSEEKITKLTNELGDIEQKMQDRYNSLLREYQENKKASKQAEIEIEHQKSNVRRINEEYMELKSRMTLSKSDAEIQEISLLHRKVQDDNLKLRNQLLDSDMERSQLEDKIKELTNSLERNHNSTDNSLNYKVSELEEQIKAINKEKHSYVQYCSYLLSLVDARIEGDPLKTLGDVNMQK